MGEHGEVQVPPTQSLASRVVAISACQPREGSTEPEGARRQAAVWSPEMCIVVDHWIIPVEAGKKADTLARVEGSSPAGVMAS